MVPIYKLYMFLHLSTYVPQQRTIKEQAKNKEEQLSFDHGALISIHVFIIT